MKEHETDWERLKHEVLASIREGVAMADIGIEELDRQVIVDERAFIARFGFDRPRRYRESLIQLKHTKDLTDREIRLLKHTGSLRFDARGVRLAASHSIAIFGRMVIGWLGLQMIYAWDLATHSTIHTPFLMLRFAALMLLLMGIGWGIHQIYVRPWLIQQRTRLSPSRDDGFIGRF